MNISASNILFLLFVAISSHAQTMELDFLKVAHGGILQKYIENEYPIIYSRNGPPVTDELIHKILQTDRIGFINKQPLVLSNLEKSEIIKHLRKYENHIWEENLFPNSKTTVRDSVLHVGFMQQNEAWAKEAKSKQLRASAFIFSKPCFIRNNTIAFVSFTDLCGGECGDVESSYYIKYDNQWHQAKSLESGNF